VVAITSPGAGLVMGLVRIAATASDDIGVTGVEFFLDGARLGGPDAEFPYETTWNTTGVANGLHVLTAVAHDAAGRQTVSSAVAVSIMNMPMP
jgi:hypothetical protein